ncbi:MAG: DUF2723 domain-containing protein [Bacteroidales bacterium]|nr:DUF2723 domain-containing protein [Bacteroidales bacterium]
MEAACRNTRRRPSPLWHRADCAVAALCGLVAGLTYVLTLEPTASFWDCGEFIATSRWLQVGHPSGAPLYTLLAHVLMLLAGSAERAAWWSNLLSAVAGGGAAYFLCRIVQLMTPRRTPTVVRWAAGAVASLAFAWSDTAWFSAVESEVYSLSVCMAGAVLWSMMRWVRAPRVAGRSRWLLLTALLLGLSVGVHLLPLLCVPTLLLLYLCGRGRGGVSRAEWRTWALGVGLLLLGCSTYLVIPICAAANPPLNEGDPSTPQRLKAYLGREQYEHAPLYPRLWRDHEGDEQLYAYWAGQPLTSRTEPVANLRYFVSYQAGYMYLRYFMWNFSGRFNHRQGYGSLQDGQFITGLSPIDRLLVGSGATPPAGEPAASGRQAYFLLPLLLGLIGLLSHRSMSRRNFWAVLLLFLTSSLLLALVLNHPPVEPRERDYVYVLSFYAFSLWMGIGTTALGNRLRSRWQACTLLLMGIPLLMGAQNLPTHNRAHRYTARDVARAHLEECPQRTVLLTVGDNDTFPLWYIQQVEGVRSDVQIVNISLLATDWYRTQLAAQLHRQGLDVPAAWQQPYHAVAHSIRELIDLCTTAGRTLQVSDYAVDYCPPQLSTHLRPLLFTARYSPDTTRQPLPSEVYRLLTHGSFRCGTRATAPDNVGQHFTDLYAQAALQAARAMAIHAPDSCRTMLDSLLARVPIGHIGSLPTAAHITATYRTIGAPRPEVETQLRSRIAALQNYYGTLSPDMRRLLPYTLQPVDSAAHLLNQTTASAAE